MNETYSADKVFEDHGTTTTLDVLKARAMLEEYIEGEGEGEGEGDTVRHHYQPKAVRVSWTQRVISWFRRS